MTHTGITLKLAINSKSFYIHREENSIIPNNSHGDETDVYC